MWIAFGQTLHHEFVNLDDGAFVYANPTVSQGLTLNGIAEVFLQNHAGNWHPLTSITHMLDCDLYGLNAGGHHSTNVLLHAATAILLFLVLRNLTAAFWPSALVAAVFAIHPLRVESVAWVTERKDVLSGLFFVLTVGTYARYARRPFSAGSYFWVLVLFTLGLLSKAMLVTVPFVLLLLDFWPLRRIPSNFRLSTLDRRLVRRLVVEKIPFLVLSAASCAVTFWAAKHVTDPIQTLGLRWRVANALAAYVTYIGQMFYPVGLAVFYPHPEEHLSWERIGLSAMVLLVISAGVFVGWRKRPYLVVGWLWYLGMLVPVIGLVQAGKQARADRFTYLPQIGLYLMITWGAVELCRYWRFHRVVLSAAAILIPASFLVLAHAQTRYWRDSVSLWTHTLACTSDNFLAYENFGFTLGEQGKWNEAVPYFERALQLHPDSAEGHYNLGFTLGQQGKWNEAIPHFERALQLKPGYPEAHYNLGYALARQRKWNEAVSHFERALQLNPDYASAHNALGVALGQQGKWNEAIPHFQRALQLNPDSVEARNNLARALGQQGK